MSKGSSSSLGDVKDVGVDVRALNIKDGATAVKDVVPVNIYISIDLPIEHDISIIAKCVEVYVNTKCPGYTVNLLQLVNVKMPPHVVYDVINDGLYTFTEMYKKLKLKEKTEVWFMYISCGRIRSIVNDVTVMLLNKNPRNHTCHYSINKNQLCILKRMTKDEKLANMRLVTSTLDELFTNDHVIKYENVKPKFDAA
jgi:hypothetical protein